MNRFLKSIFSSFVRIAAFTLSSIFLFSQTMANSTTISYTLGMSKPQTHLLEVEMKLDSLDTNEKTLEVAMPNWRTGRYLILDFAGGIVEFNVVDGAGKPLLWKKTDKSTWRIETNNSPAVRVQYKVFANEFNLRTRGLNDEHAFVDGSAVFMYADKYRWQPVTLTVIPFGNWHVTTGLDSVAGKRNEFTAQHYEHLADCPMEIGNQKDFNFTVMGKDHVLSMAGEGNYDAAVLISDITKIVEENTKFWGGLPYERYVFMFSLSPSAGGGTEHINSAAMGAKPFIFKSPETYPGFRSLVSHEFFHTWNVKRLRPAALNTFDWTKESYTKELWIAEGTTSYYSGLMLLRAGFSTAQQYTDNIASAVESDRGRPGNLRQSLSDCSFDAWIKFWKSGKQSFNFDTDYYGRGSSVSLILDLTIRHTTNNKHSLDDVMREMYRQFPLGKGGYTIADFRNVSEQIAGSSLQQLFDDYVDGSKPLPWEEALSYAGLILSEKSPEKKIWLGATTNDVGEKTIVNRVVAGSPAYEAGLDPDDEIVALDGYKVRTRDLISRISDLKEGTRVRLTVFRDDRLREFDVVLRTNENVPMKVTKVEKPSALQKAIYSSWLASSTESKEKK